MFTKVWEAIRDGGDVTAALADAFKTFLADVIAFLEKTLGIEKDAE